jgi:predicted Zn-dependent peptidase
VSLVDRSRLPEVGSEPPFHFPVADKDRLANGLGLWTVERPRLPLVSLRLSVSAGSAADPAGRHGLAALTADMLDEGTGDRSAIEITEALGRLGTELDTEIGPDSVTIGFTVLRRHLSEAMHLLADIVVRPRLVRDDVERVRTLRLNRLRQFRDVPSALAEQAFATALYGDHPYGHLAIGTTRSLETMGAEEVARFHQAAYRPLRATLIAVGDITQRDVRQTAEAAFGGWDAGAGTPGDAVARPPGEPRARLVVLDRPGAAQTELRLGHVAVARNTEHFHPLVLLNAMLGGQFVSRINMNLRERRGYTYGVRTFFDFRRLPGPFVLATSVQTAATVDAIRESIGEIAAIRADRPPTPDELEMAKASLTRGYARHFESSAQVSHALAQLVVHALPDDTFETFAPRVNGLCTEDVTRVANAHLDPDRLVIVAVGDRSRIESELASLGRGTPAVWSGDF